MPILKYTLSLMLTGIYPFIVFSQTVTIMNQTASHPKSKQNLSADQNIKALELRNYILKPGQRENFTNLFESTFIIPQQEAGSFPLGVFKVKGADNNFFWIRGFHNMATRNKALNEFYHGDVWKQNRTAANSMIVNNDNVYLLKPLFIGDNEIGNDPGFNTNWFEKQEGITVIDFYISNTKLDKLIEFVKKQYTGLLSTAGIETTSFWVSEMTTNDFPGLPVFQDKNLLVQVSFYKDELTYQTKIKAMESKLTDEQKIEIGDLVTIKNTLILYPTEKTFPVHQK
ncbi:MAG: family containing protein [Chitinophagaceae bacterium]|nr:family containing protein [Chitinophagaceae bacterium]